MSKEKQIEEMARLICEGCADHGDCKYDICDMLLNEANRLYNAGYRKITTTDWLTKGIPQEQIEREKEDAFAEVAERLGYRKQSEWISVDERLPETRETILYCDGKWVDACYFDGDSFMTLDTYESDTIYKVTHWMPLPEAPKMGGEA